MDTFSDKDPTAPGWYAVLVCYDPSEGAFPSGAYWDGKKWRIGSIVGCAGPFANEKSAEEWAYAHDPDDLKE